MTAAIHGKFIWCELMTSDPAAAGAFYSKVIGWQIRDLSMPDGSGQYTIFQRCGPGEDQGAAGMMAIPPELEGKACPSWTGYVAVDDVDAMAARFEAMGGALHRPPEDIPDIGRFAVVADPQGAVLCIMTPLPMDEGPDFPDMEPGTVGWHELQAADGEVALAFYAEVFGWQEDQVFDMGPMGAYRIFSHEGKPIGGMMTKPRAEIPPFWSYYFVVDSIDGACQRLTEAHGSIVNGPMEVPGGSFIVNARDPQGAVFSLTAPRR